MVLTSTFDIPAHVVAQQVDGELVILDLESGIYFGLDAVGSRFWALASEGHSLKGVCDVMLKEYNVDAETLQNDISSLANDLEQRKLIVVRQN